MHGQGRHGDSTEGQNCGYEGYLYGGIDGGDMSSVVGEAGVWFYGTDFKHVIHELSRLLGALNLGHFVPALGWLDLPGFKRDIRNVCEISVTSLLTVIST